MTARPLAEHEVQRILALVPWLDAHPGARVEQIAARFGITEDQVEADLALVLMVGVPPYTPAEYIDVVIDDERHVWLRLGDVFRRPLRLSADEGLALLAAGRALLAVHGSDPDGPLATALVKLAEAVGAPNLRVDVGADAHLASVQDAVDAGRQVEIAYWSAGRGEHSTRVVDPHVVFFATGAWYLSAFCHTARDERMFRIDRIRGVKPTGREVEVVASGLAPPESIFTPDASDPRVTLLVSPPASWIVEEFPVEHVETEQDGRQRLVLAVSEPAWLERLLVQHGPALDVVDPPEWRDRRRTAAARILARYRRSA